MKHLGFAITIFASSLAAACSAGRGDVAPDGEALSASCPIRADAEAFAGKQGWQLATFPLGRDYPWGVSQAAWRGPDGGIDKLHSGNVACFFHPEHEPENLAALNRLLRAAGRPPPSVSALSVARAVVEAVAGEPYVIGDGEDCMDARSFVLAPMRGTASKRFRRFCAGRASWEIGKKRLAFDVITARGALERWLVEMPDGTVVRLVTKDLEAPGTFPVRAPN